MDSSMIANTIHKLVEEKAIIDLSSIYKNLETKIKESYNEERDLSRLRQLWKNKIITAASAMETKVIVDNNEKACFEEILGESSTSDNNNNNNNGATSSNNSNDNDNNNNKTAKNTTTTSPKSISAEDRAIINNNFAAMDPEKMWVLSSGKKVEETMQQYGLRCKYEDTAHSMIFDFDNNELAKCFTTEEINEIKTTRLPPDLTFPTNLAVFLTDISATNSAKAAAKVARINDFDDDGDDANDCRWAQLSVIQAAGLFLKRGQLDFETMTEGDILHRPWRVLYTCCECSVVDSHDGEVISKASANSKNFNRQPQQSVTDRYQVGAKMDGIYIGRSRELGCIEAGRPTKNNTNKEIEDGYLKLPKSLKDMLAQLVKEERLTMASLGDNNNNSNRQRLMTIGFIVMGQKIQKLQMDWPCGYVARLTRSRPYYFPRDDREFPKKYAAIIKLVWSGLKEMEGTLDFIVNNEQDILVEGIDFPGNNDNNTNTNDILLQPSFHCHHNPNNSSNSNKKRKSS